MYQTYIAETSYRASGMYDDLKEAINTAAQQRGDELEERHGLSDGVPDEIEVGCWAHGPLLRVEAKDEESGETKRPCFGNRLVKVIHAAGYVPWGFRPEKEGDEHTGRWMWYFRTLEEVSDGDFYDTVYGIQREDDKFLRDDENDLISFESESAAQTVADGMGDGYIAVEVLQ